MRLLTFYQINTKKTVLVLSFLPEIKKPWIFSDLYAVFTYMGNYWQISFIFTCNYHKLFPEVITTTMITSKHVDKSNARIHCNPCHNYDISMYTIM